MKTSNKLFIIAAILAVSFLFVHDYAIKAAYLKGDYKDRFYQMKNLPLADFDAVELGPTGFTNLRIEQGPEFAIWIDKQAENGLAFKKNKRTLSIAQKTNEDWSQYNVTIICPGLKSFAAKAKDPKIGFSTSANIFILGFKQDTMRLQTSAGNSVTLTSSVINKLDACSDITGGQLSLYPNDHITESNFNMQGGAELRLYDLPSTGKISYKFSPESMVTLSNNALQLFRR